MLDVTILKQAYVLSPAFGLRPYLGQPLPIAEGELPETYLALTEEFHDQLAMAVSAVLTRWLSRRAADTVVLDRRRPLGHAITEKSPYSAGGRLQLAHEAKGPRLHVDSR